MRAEPSLKDMQELSLEELQKIKEIKETERESLDLKLMTLFLAKDKRRKSPYRLFPILYDVIGEEAFLNLLRVMAGLQVYFPSEAKIVEAQLAISIYQRVNKIEKKKRVKRGQLIDKLSERFNCDARSLYNKVNNAFK